MARAEIVCTTGFDNAPGTARLGELRPDQTWCVTIIKGARALRELPT